MNAEIAQEPAVNTSTSSSLRSFMRNVVQLITGATTGDLTAEAAQHAQGPTDLPEVKYQTLPRDMLPISLTL